MNFKLSIRRINPKFFICKRCISSTTLLYDKRTNSNTISQLSNLQKGNEIIKHIKDSYTQGNITFLEDYTKSNKEDLPSKFLRKKVPIDYLLKDLIEIMIKGDISLITNNIQTLKEEKLWPKRYIISTEINQIRRDFLHYLINYNHLSLATSLLLQFQQNHLSYHKSDITLLINAIKNSSIRDFPINSYCILQIIQHFNLTTMELYKCFQYLTSIQIGNYYSNYLFFKLHRENMLVEFNSKQFNKILISLLNLNLENQDIIKSLQIWKISKPLIQNLNQSQIKELTNLIVTIFKLYHDQPKIESEIENLPNFIKQTSEFLNYDLDYYSNHSPTSFKNLIKNLSSPLKRSTLTSLLKGFIKIEDEINAEKIIETIFQTSNLNQDELNIIVEKLLAENKLNEALSMIRRMSLEISKKSYLTIFKKFETFEDNDQKIYDFYKELYLKFMKLDPGDEVLKEFTVSIIEKLSKIDNKQATRYLIKFMKLTDFQNYQINKIENFINFQKYNMLNEFKNLISLDHFAIVSCLKIISKQAVSQKDYIILNWVINEFRKLGWEISTIVEYLLYFDSNNNLRKMMKKRAFIDVDSKNADDLG
ncbi:uncharacterized protein KGF55_002115 [Candida pseudojiufengensis]|uniref:uncharacterized protein n=1 Tax=Candida pseudojiufengensis TaxID=497109 RepID=UPI0022251763|nr:uncharacterized protein KGF55_002115 [Candida pseudojiufengensis]KAI5964173.1 hypothetical protein KGF55_002115 [Candida pseudojiufengensis]